MPYGVQGKVWRSLSQAAKNTAKEQYYKSQTAINEAKLKNVEQKQQLKAAKEKVRQIERKNSINPFNRIADTIKAKHEAKVAKIRAEAENVRLDPKAKQKQIETDAEVAKITAKGKADAFKYTAIATGAATLGRGLSDENNQDNQARMQADQKKTETIFNSMNDASLSPNARISGSDNKDDSYGLNDGVY